MKTPIPIRLAALAMLACLASSPAYAATATTTFQVTASVAATCSTSATNMAFGAYSGTVIDQTSTITVTCTNTTGYTVALNDGVNYSAPNRRMTDATNYLNYELYSDAGRSSRWGDDPDWVSGTGNGSAQSLTVYGRLPAGQALFIGSYTDTITVTVTY